MLGLFKSKKKTSLAKVLVVDDEVEICRLLQAFLTKKGFEVSTATGGQQALEELKKEKDIDLLILDIMMPTMTGPEVLRQMEKESLNIPVIVLTGSLSDASFLKEYSLVKNT